MRRSAKNQASKPIESPRFLSLFAPTERAPFRRNLAVALDRFVHITYLPKTLYYKVLKIAKT